MKLLYNSFCKAMLSLSYRITQNMEESEDILQEAFLRSFQQISQLSDAQKYPSWLKRITINLSINTIRKKRSFETLELMDKVAAEEVEDHWYQQIPFAVIQQAINELPNGCREIFTLYLLEEYKHREIAALLHISESTSKSQYRYGLKLMKQKLKHFQPSNN